MDQMDLFFVLKYCDYIAAKSSTIIVYFTIMFQDLAILKWGGKYGEWHSLHKPSQ